VENLISSKVTATSNNESKTQDQQGMQALTSEEILAVAGGPEVDIETGGGN
jgi:hypothetical protein